jgi:hypothetical protein
MCVYQWYHTPQREGEVHEPIVRRMRVRPLRGACLAPTATSPIYINQGDSKRTPKIFFIIFKWGESSPQLNL